MKEQLFILQSMFFQWQPASAMPEDSSFIQLLAVVGSCLLSDPLSCCTSPHLLLLQQRPGDLGAVELPRSPSAPGTLPRRPVHGASEARRGGRCCGAGSGDAGELMELGREG